MSMHAPDTSRESTTKPIETSPLETIQRGVRAKLDQLRSLIRGYINAKTATTVLALIVGAGSAQAQEKPPAGAPTVVAKATAPEKDTGGTLIIDGAGMSFMDFFKKFGRSPEKMAKLGQFDEKLETKYLQWEADIDKTDIGNLETKKVALDQETQKVEAKKVALDQAEILKKISLDIQKSIGLSIETPASIVQNKEYAKIIEESLLNPLIRKGLSTKGIAILEAMASHLKTGKNIVYIDPKVWKDIESL